MNKYLTLVLLSITCLFSANILAEVKLFPDIEGQDFYTDETVKFSDLLANKTSLVNVWASWCTTCRKEHQMIMNIAGKDLKIKHIDGPLGVRGRNSDNNLIKKVLNWSPTQPLKEGLEKTYKWIEKQVKR